MDLWINYGKWESSDTRMELFGLSLGGVAIL